jgi:hypothetical protein
MSDTIATINQLITSQIPVARFMGLHVKTYDGFQLTIHSCPVNS